LLFCFLCCIYLLALTENPKKIEKRLYRLDDVQKKPNAALGDEYYQESYSNLSEEDHRIAVDRCSMRKRYYTIFTQNK
jgi:hypothetical protein